MSILFFIAYRRNYCLYTIVDNVISYFSIFNYLCAQITVYNDQKNSRFR